MRWGPVALGLAACGGSDRMMVIGPRDVPSAGSAPRISAVHDLGLLPHGPSAGRLPADTDGQFVIGEHVLIEGENFGKLPTVTIGAEPATVLARTAGGGILTQIPPGVPPGRIAIKVAQPLGQHGRDIEVHRYGLVAQTDANQIHVVDVREADAKVRTGAIASTQPQRVKFSGDGSLAYVVSADGNLSVIAMGAAGGPRTVHAIRTKVGPIGSLAVAQRSPLLAVIGAEKVQLFSLALPVTPAPYEPFALPKDMVAAKVVAADLDPQARRLALLLATTNRVALFDVSEPGEPKLAKELAVLAGERLPLVRDMSFSSSGEALWVVSGDSDLSLDAGSQPTRVSLVPVLTDVDPETVEVDVPAPLHLAVGRALRVPSGTAVRTRPAKESVFVTTTRPGILVHADFERITKLDAVPAALSALDVTSDHHLVLATACQGTSTRGFGLAVVPLSGSPRYVALGGPCGGDVRIQP